MWSCRPSLPPSPHARTDQRFQQNTRELTSGRATTFSARTLSAPGGNVLCWELVVISSFCSSMHLISGRGKMLRVLHEPHRSNGTGSLQTIPKVIWRIQLDPVVQELEQTADTTLPAAPVSSSLLFPLCRNVVHQKPASHAGPHSLTTHGQWSPLVRWLLFPRSLTSLASSLSLLPVSIVHQPLISPQQAEV